MKSVHTYVEMVQCPVCRYTFMQLGDECCWRCAPESAAPTPADLTRAREFRQSAEVADGSLGSLAGLGFAPLGPSPVVFGAPTKPPGGKAVRPDSASAALALRWLVVIVWVALMLLGLVRVLQHHPFIGP